MFMNAAIPPPPVLHPGQIEAMYINMRNNNEWYIGQLGGVPLSIGEWRARELARWNVEKALC